MSQANSDFITLLMIDENHPEKEECLLTEDLREFQDKVFLSATTVVCNAMKKFVILSRERRKREQNLQEKIRSIIRNKGRSSRVQPLEVSARRTHNKSHFHLHFDADPDALDEDSYLYIKSLVHPLKSYKSESNPVIDIVKEGNVKLLKELISNSKQRVLKPKFSRRLSLSLSLMPSSASNQQRRHSLPGKQDDSPLSRLINQRDAYGRSAFTSAIEHRNWECARILMEEDKIDTSVVDISENTALHLLLGSDEYDKWQDILQSMLEKHFMDPNARNREGVTPLMIAASNPDVDAYGEGALIETLVGLKANPLIADQSKRRALDHAAANGNLKSLERLMRLMRVTEEEVDEVLFNVIDSPQEAQMRTVDFLVRHGASLSCRKKGDSLLNAAARNNQLKCLAHLLERLPRSELKYRNPKGFSALHSAVAFGWHASAEMIFNKIFPPESPSKSRYAASHAREVPRRKGDFSEMIDGKLIEAAVLSKSAKIILHSLGSAQHLKNVEFKVEKDLPESWKAKFGEEFSEEEIRANISTIFQLIDSDNSGSITVNEMIGGLSRQGIFLSVTAAKDLVASMDVDGTGEIEFSEFEAAIKGGLKRQTNLLCWSISNRLTAVVQYLVDIGVDVNKTDPGGEKLSPLMLLISCLSLSSWSQYAIKSIIQEDEDALKLELDDVSSITSMTKPQIRTAVEYLKDLKGNPLKSPSGKPLFTRNPWRFSWNGLKAICSSSNSDLNKKIETYTQELCEYKDMYQLLLRCPGLQVDLEVRGKTSAALAAQYQNWKVYEDLLLLGASACHPSVLLALSVSNSQQRLRASIAQVEGSCLTEAALQEVFDATCEAGSVECAWVLHEYAVRRGWRIVRTGHLKQVVRGGQSWMIDLVSHFDRSAASLGEALVESIICRDLGSFNKLLDLKADPNFQLAPEQPQQSPLTIAGRLWCQTGSTNHLQMVLELIRRHADLSRRDEDGRHAILWASVKGHEPLLRLCLENLRSEEVREVVDLKDKFGMTALMYAVLACSGACVRLLLDARANADVLSSPRGDDVIPMTALGFLTSMAQEAAPEFLLPLLRCTNRLADRDACGDTLLTWAARWGHSDAVRVLLEEKQEQEFALHELNADGYSALELACMAQHRSICRMLVDTWSRSTANPDSTKQSDYAGLAVLERCWEYEWPDVALSVIERICPFDRESPVVKRAVFECLQRKWFDCLRALLKPPRSVDPTSKNVIESSPLLLASRKDDKEALKELLDANVRELEMAVLCCIFYGYMSSFELLWQNPSLLLSQDFLRACACLASLRNNVHVLQRVLKRVGPNMDIYSKTPKLRFVMKQWCSNRVLIRDLPDLHRYLEIEDPSVPLLCAISHGHLKSAMLLLESKADPLVQDYHGVSAITWACAVGNIDVVQALLKFEVPINLAPNVTTVSFSQLRSFYAGIKMRQLGSLTYVRKTRLMDLLDVKSPTLVMSPLFAALMKGNPDVVRLLMEAGAHRQELIDWCEDAMALDPRVEPMVSDMLLLAMEYEDFKTFGPFGNAAYGINFSDAPLVPAYGSLHAVIAQFSATEWKLEAIQMIHRVDEEFLPLRIHHTTSSLAGKFLHNCKNTHLERFDLAENEFIIQAEVAIWDSCIHALRFTTNQRVCKWLGVKSEPEKGSRLVTVSPAGRELVGLFSACEERFYQIGFITRLRMGDIAWRPKRDEEKGAEA